MYVYNVAGMLLRELRVCTVRAELYLNPMTGVMNVCKHFGQLFVTGKALYKKQLLLLLLLVIFVQEIT